MSQYLYLPYGHQAMNVHSSGLHASNVALSDTNTLPATRGLYVGGSGNLNVTMQDGEDVSFVAVTAGVILPISVIKVKATGTTATNIVAVY